MGAGLAEPHEVAAFLAERQEVLSIRPAQGTMKPPRVWGQMPQEGRFPFKHTLVSGARTSELQANEREEFPWVPQEEPGFPGEAAETQVDVELRPPIQHAHPTVTLTASLGWIPRRPQPPLRSPDSNHLRVWRFATSCIHPHPPVTSLTIFL